MYTQLTLPGVPESLPTDTRPVLDKGYVRLVDTLGNDLAVVNAARVSYDKESDSLTERDKGLVRFLANHDHTSPFRHAAMTFEVYAPLMVARQWWKYAVASTHVDDQNGWNESSRRYVTETPEFYLPDEWLSAPADSKQGSGEALSAGVSVPLTHRVREHYLECERMYDELMDLGVAPEQARLVLPAYALYVRWRWTVSLHGVINFLHQRLPEDAQSEIRKYADAVYDFVLEAFPVSAEAFDL